MAVKALGGIVLAAKSSGKQLARAIRPVPIKLITVSKGIPPGTSAMAGEWAEKLRRYTSLTEHMVKSNPKKASEPDVIMQSEAERVLKLITPQERVVVLDERGKDITSEGLANLIAKAGDDGVTSLAFCIGGPYGHDESVRRRGDSMIRLSSLVLNHQVAQVVLLEALYRSHTILRGEPYHH